MKFQMKPVDWLSGLAYVSSGGLTAAFALGGPRVILVGAAITATAGLLARMLNNKTDKPATSVVANAPVVPAGTPPPLVPDAALGVNSHRKGGVVE